MSTPTSPSDALVSPCGTYRYWLTRLWDDSKPKLAFVMLNPSTADASEDDPTIRRCIGFARDRGYGGLIVFNLFALRATDPRELRKVRDPVGPDNDRWLADAFATAAVTGEPIITAWGVHGALNERAARVKRRAQEAGAQLMCLGTSKDGHPKHPLYIAAAQPFVTLAA